MALTSKGIKAWRLVHNWTSLICTVFLLMLALTGLPLIFHDEIDAFLGDTIAPATGNQTAAPATLDDIVAAAKAARPNLVVRYLIWDPDEPGIIKVNMAVAIDSPRGQIQMLSVDERSAEVRSTRIGRRGVMAFILQLHTDMFLGLGGSLFLGVMGLLFVTSIISGVVLYGPFMRKLPFGTVRHQRGRRVRWLDLHNLVGIVTVAWCLVVGLTGVINTLDIMVFRLWRADQLAAMTAPYKDKPPLRTIASVEAAVAVARRAVPDMTPSFAAFPGTFFSSNHHFAVFMRGSTPLTAQLLKPVLIDAETLQLTDVREPPWYVSALELSRPLHFGDYGGFPLKIIWLILDLMTIVLLGSGLYLWIGGRRTTRSAPAAGTEPVTKTLGSAASHF